MSTVIIITLVVIVALQGLVYSNGKEDKKALKNANIELKYDAFTLRNKNKSLKQQISNMFESYTIKGLIESKEQIDDLNAQIDSNNAEIEQLRYVNDATAEDLRITRLHLVNTKEELDVMNEKFNELLHLSNELSTSQAI